MQIPELVTTVLVSSAASTALVFLLRTWLSERLRQSIAHEYAVKLEAHRAALKAEQDIALERLRADTAQQMAMHTASFSAFAEAHKAAHERRLQAISALWTALNMLRREPPPALFVWDTLPVALYPDFFTHPPRTLALKPLTIQSIAEFLERLSRATDDARPFAGDFLYAPFAAYETIVARALFLLLDGQNKRQLSPWFEDETVRRLLAQILTEQELQRFDQIPINKLNWLGGTIQNALAARIAQVISGEASANASMAQSQRIFEVVRDVEARADATPTNR